MLMIVMMRRLMADIVGMLLFAIHGDDHVGAGDAALLGALARETDAGQPKPVHPLDEGVGIGDEFQQRGHEHIARRAHIAFEIQRLHSAIPFIWLMRFAR